jgi:hypothetical protein
MWVAVKKRVSHHTIAPQNGAKPTRLSHLALGLAHAEQAMRVSPSIEDFLMGGQN